MLEVVGHSYSRVANSPSYSSFVTVMVWSPVLRLKREAAIMDVASMAKKVVCGAEYVFLFFYKYESRDVYCLVICQLRFRSLLLRGAGISQRNPDFVRVNGLTPWF